MPDVNPLGPDQLYEEPPLDVKLKVEPTHCGELLPAVAVGNGLTTTDVVATAVQPLPPVTVTLYNPDAAKVTFAMDGF